jgi:hypothetical protein
MNQMDLEISTENVDESHSEPMHNTDVTAMQEANKTPPKASDDDKIIQSPPTRFEFEETQWSLQFP